MRCIGFVIAATLAPLVADAGGLRHEVVIGPTVSTPIDVVPNKIFLNRCVGGCTIRHGTTNDARTHTSIIPAPATNLMSAWAWTDQEWNDLVQCVKEVYSPFGVTVTDVQPDVSEDYNEGVVAGVPAELGLPDDYGGIAPLAPECQVVDHGLSFSFANAYTQSVERVHEICWTVAQEVGHTYGLDHEYEFYDRSSACNDPMTYRSDCGGQKFFRDKTAHCGEYTARDCLCGVTQNDHRHLVTFLGTATPITTGAVSITSPAANETIGDGYVVHAMASAQRGVATVQLVLNGYVWLEVPGVAFGPTGQPASDYALALPADVPDSIIDVQVIEKDDLDIAVTSSTVTVTKGAACVDASTCAKGQQCAAGKCYWDPPAGELGDVCDYPQFCKSGRCDTLDGKSFCTQDCSPDDTTSCPMGLECLASTPDAGMCWPPSSGGCCSTGRGNPAWHFGLSALVLAIAIRRRRRG
jgi:MYXO-CTERM domain-containing protein